MTIVPIVIIEVESHRDTEFLLLYYCDSKLT